MILRLNFVEEITKKHLQAFWVAAVFFFKDERSFNHKKIKNE